MPDRDVRRWQAISDDLAHALYHTWYIVYGIEEGEDADDHFATDTLRAYDAMCDYPSAETIAKAWLSKHD